MLTVDLDARSRRPPLRPVTSARTVRRSASMTGTVVAVAFFALTQTPSLLPRSWLLQGVVAGVTASIGYAIGAALGVVLAWVVRRSAPQLTTPGAVHRAWWVVAAVGGVVVSVSLMQGGTWQRETRALVGMDQDQTWYVSLILLLAVSLTVALVLLARCVLLGARLLGRWLRRFVPQWAASATGGVVAAVLVGGFLQGFLYDNVVDVVDASSSVTNDATPPGIAQPSAAERSGSPDSLVEWSTLGYRGREFAGTAPSAGQLSDFSGGPAREPVRVYVGLESAESPQARVDLALAELDRTGAWDRSALVVYTTTGTGWVNQRSVRALEYLLAGDSAVVAMQYSYLPSWISVLTDGDRAAEAGRLLITAVQERWARLPVDDRPSLLVYGESLGSRGTEAAFGDMEDLTERTDGALLVGPTDGNALWREAVGERETGTPVWLPVVDSGRVVRFANAPGDLDAPSGRWADSRVVYLQNSSDPVVWWSPRLFWDPPEFLRGDRGPDVSPSMRWYPVVTFWQVTVDLLFANHVPLGHGHRYGPELVDGWVALVSPEGWTAQDTERLRAVVLDGQT